MSKLHHWVKQYRTKLSGLLGISFLFLAKPTSTSLLMGFLLIVIGEAIRIWSSGHIHKNQILTVTGPYSLSRNPLYVGSFILGTGFMIAMGVVWLALVFLVFYAVIYGFTIRWEEDKLGREFPGAWEEYKRNVPRFFPIGRIPDYKPGDFSWSQVTKHKELLNASVVLLIYAILWGKALFVGQ